MTEAAIQQQLQQTSVLSRFANFQGDQASSEIEKCWQALTEIKDVVNEQVRNNNLTPVAGLGVLACATGQIFGYQEFHGQPGPADQMTRQLYGPNVETVKSARR